MISGARMREKQVLRKEGCYHVILGEKGISMEAGKMRGKVPFCFSTHRKTQEDDRWLEELGF